MVVDNQYSTQKEYLSVDDNPLGKRFSKIPSRLEKELHSSAPLALRPNAREPVGVEVSYLDGDVAYCKARVYMKDGKINFKKGKIVWFPIRLNAESLRRCDLGRNGDYFEWVLRGDGIVREEDIILHPRRFMPGEAERICKEAEEYKRKHGINGFD